MKPAITQKHFITKDGTKLGYQLVGKGTIPFVLCNGLGGTAVTWSPIWEEFYENFQFIIWDYRGLFSSEPPKDLSKLTIEDHSNDLKELLDFLKIDSAIIGGWSMGVQVALEFYKNYADRVKAHFFNQFYKSIPIDHILSERHQFGLHFWQGLFH